MLLARGTVEVAIRLIEMFSRLEEDYGGAVFTTVSGWMEFFNTSESNVAVCFVFVSRSSERFIILLTWRRSKRKYHTMWRRRFKGRAACVWGFWRCKNLVKARHMRSEGTSMVSVTLFRYRMEFLHAKICRTKEPKLGDTERNFPEEIMEAWHRSLE